MASFNHEGRIKVPLLPIDARVHAKKRHQQVGKVFSSRAIPVMGIAMLKDTVEGLNIPLPKSIPVATQRRGAD